MGGVCSGLNGFKRVACGGVPHSPAPQRTGARRMFARLFYTGRGEYTHPIAPYRGAVAGRKCGPRPPMLGARSGFGLTAHLICGGICNGGA